MEMMKGMKMCVKNMKNDEKLWNTMKMMKMHEPENGETQWKIITDTVKNTKVCNMMNNYENR